MNAVDAADVAARLPIALHYSRPADHEGPWYPQPMVRVGVLCPTAPRRLEMPALIDTGAAVSGWPLNIARLLLGAAADDLEPDEPTIPATGVEQPCLRYPPGLDVEVGGYRVRLHARFIDTKLNHGVLGLNDFLDQFDMVVRWADHELRLYPRPSVELADAAQEAA